MHLGQLMHFRPHRNYPANFFRAAMHNFYARFPFPEVNSARPSLWGKLNQCRWKLRSKQEHVAWDGHCKTLSTCVCPCSWTLTQPTVSLTVSLDCLSAELLRCRLNWHSGSIGLAVSMLLMDVGINVNCTSVTASEHSTSTLANARSQLT